jgi:NADPH:quinone reductase-like Zn-dependent oxidoreductase
MEAVHLIGIGGFDVLRFRTDVAVPQPGEGQVLIRVGAAGVNNTDINTRIGWYSKSVSGGTEASQAEAGSGGPVDDGSWTGEALAFPRIQGADACGQIIAVGNGVSNDRIGQRVLVRTMQNPEPDVGVPQASRVFGSEVDGGFAQYAVAESRHALAVDCAWSDIELASIPCAYSTAEGMLHRVELGAERVLVTGASGGVGSAAVQLAKRRGAEVIAVSGAAKADAVRAIGADRVVTRNADVVAELGRDSVDVVVDLVAGPQWPSLLDVLRIGGRYVVAGAIAGPLVELDVRTLYLKDLTLHGCTYQPDVIMENLISYIEGGEISPLVAGTYTLADIVAAQKDFLAKGFVGKLVLIP